MKTKTNKYRECPYCKRKVPPQYNFNEHKGMCKKINNKL